MRFTDELQSQFDQLLLDLEHCLHSLDPASRLSLPRLLTQLTTLLSATSEKHTSSRPLRLTQALIDHLGTTTQRRTLPTTLTTILDHLTTIETPLTSPSPASFIELSTAYTQQQKRGDTHKGRNLCLLISLYASSQTAQPSGTCLKLFQSLGPYLLRTLLESLDHYSQLFAILALENLALDRGVLQNLRKNDRLRHKLNSLLGQQCSLNIDARLYGNSEVSSEQLIDYQVSFCACLFLEQLLHDRRIDPRQAKTLQRSNANQSVRSDVGWNEVQLDSYQIASGVAFYEVLLLTDGHMEIGWSTLGSPTCCHAQIESVRYDGHAGAIVLDGTKKSTEEPGGPGSRRPWKAGDFLGCLADLGPKPRLVFYLNGRLVEEYVIEEPGQVALVGPRSREEAEPAVPYFPTARLSPYQQVYYNFGDLPWRYPPEVEFEDLRSSRPVFVPTACLIQ